MQRLRFVTLCYANYGNFFLEIHQNHQEKVMHFWCTFESASKVHQNPMKVHQKCIMFFWRFWWFFQKIPWLQCKIFIFNALSSKFDLSFEDVLLKFPSYWFNICFIFIALSLHFWKCKPSAIVFVGAFIDCILIALSKVQSKCNGFWEIFTLHESNKISLKSGTLSKTTEEVPLLKTKSHCRSPTRFQWRDSSSEAVSNWMNPTKLITLKTLKRFSCETVSSYKSPTKFH